MADHRIGGQPWPDGTVVQVFPAEARPASSDGAPSGAAVTTGIVSASAVTFTGLATGLRYIAWAAGKAIAFLIGPGAVDLLRDITGAEAQAIRDALEALGIDVDAIEGQAPVPSLNGFAPLLPASGATITLKATNVSNGTDTVGMARYRVPVTDDVHLFAPVWAGWGMQQSSDPADAGALISEVDVPNTVRVSAAVETIDGRVYQLSAAGSKRWTVATGGQVQCDPLDIDVPASDGYFWMRCRVEVDTGGVWWQGRAVTTSVTGESLVFYAVDPTLTYKAAVLALSPTAYWSLDAATGGNDLTVNNRDAVPEQEFANPGGTVPGAALGPFPGGATEFNGLNWTMGTDYNPFINGQSLSVAGTVYCDPTSAITTMFGSDAPVTCASCRILANGNVDFLPASGGTHVVWAITFPTSAWTHWALVFDEVANTVELWINGVSQTSKACPTAFDATPGDFRIGGFQLYTSAFDGRMAHVAVFAGVKLTNTNVGSLYSAFLTQASDQTGGTGVLPTLGSSSSGSGAAHSPVLLTGKFDPLVRKPIVAIWGDSITEGVGDSPDATDGFATKGCRGASVPSVKCGKGSERGVTQTIGSRIARRLAISDGATHALYEHGTNDYRTAVLRATPGYLAANTLINSYRLKNRGQAVYACTLIPAASSSDGWATLGNQTRHVNDLWRTRYNDWLRLGAPVCRTTLGVAQAINGASITGLISTSGFPDAGLAIIGGVLVHYTGKTDTSLTGVAAAIAPYAAPTAAVVPAGALVFAVPGWVATQAGSGQTLPLATINLTAGFTTDGFAASGSLLVGCAAAGGNQTVAYTGLTSTSFTGCTGGAGAVGSSGILQDLALPAVTVVSGATDHPLAGFLEIADTVESARNSGKWVVLQTADGVHPTAAGHTAMAVPVTAWASGLVVA